MPTYLWEKQHFFNDFKQVLLDSSTFFVNIASAYISLQGAQQLRQLTEHLRLDQESIQIYCSAKFNEQQPAETLTFLSTFATVHIVHEPFLHSKAYEIHAENKVTTYSGSANLTDGGLLNNCELMVKTTDEEAPLEEFWGHLWQNCLTVDEEVIAFYRELPKVSRLEETEQVYTKLAKKLRATYKKQCIESHYPDLTGYYFTVDDYRIFNEAYWQSGAAEVQMKRKATQDKLYELNEAIRGFAARHDLYPHYNEENLTSGIVPSIFNFERVTGIWMRYGKHESELKPFGASKSRKKSSPIEYFHKHACLQLSIGSKGLNIGMFHSTANDGVDCHHVDEHWHDIKPKILDVYDALQGYDFIWTFHSNREDRTIATFELDMHTAEQFVAFYRKYDMQGYESFCMRYYDTDDLCIKTYKGIVKEVEESFKAILPLYKAMTFRIPAELRKHS